MRTLFAFLWFGLRLCLFPLRYALYVIHGLLIFISKPGARIILPALAATALALCWDAFKAATEAPLALWLPEIQELLGPDLYPEVFRYRALIAALALLLAGIILLKPLAELLRPIIGAFPAPARPLLPHPPFIVPTLRIRRVPVRVAVPALPPSRLKGNRKALERRLPPEIRELLTRPRQPAGRYPGPAELTPATPLWPPLSSAAPAPEPAGAPEAAPTKRQPARKTATRRSAATRSASANSGAPPVPPPPPKRSRKAAAAAAE